MNRLTWNMRLQQTPSQFTFKIKKDDQDYHDQTKMNSDPLCELLIQIPSNSKLKVEARTTSSVQIHLFMFIS